MKVGYDGILPRSEKTHKLNLLIHKNSKASMRDLGEWIDLTDSDTTFIRAVQVKLSE